MIPRFSLKTMLIIVCAIALAIAATMEVSRRLNATVRDGYAQQIVVTLLIKFMEENEGKWPESWNSLKSLYERDHPNLKARIFEEMEQRIFVDFSADIQRMREDSLTTEKPTFRVVFAKFTSGFHPIGEPNSTIYHYLRKTLEEKAPEER